MRNTVRLRPDRFSGDGFVIAFVACAIALSYQRGRDMAMGNGYQGSALPIVSLVRYRFPIAFWHEVWYSSRGMGGVPLPSGTGGAPRTG